MNSFWLAFRYFKSSHRHMSLTAFLAILGMVLGVASVVVAMAVVSGYSTTLKNTVTDLIGHVTILKSTLADKSDQQMEALLRDKLPEFKAITPFLHVEAVLAHGGKLNGVLVEGLDSQSWQKVMRLETRLQSGSLSFSEIDGVPQALVGKEIAKKFALQLGDEFRLVVPKSEDLNQDRLRPRVVKFRLAGILNLGRHDYDQRYVLVDYQQANELAGGGVGVAGYRVRLETAEQAEKVSFKLAQLLGTSYWIRYWKDANRNLFEAAQLEKLVLFFILQVIVAAACFNIMSTLYVSVLRRYQDISILKTIGARNGFILRVFTWQGVLVGIAGSLIGVVLGLLLCQGFLWLQDIASVMPKEVYKLDRVEVEIRALDLAMTFGASLFVCLIATIFPAHWGSRLTPTEGLRYE